MKVGASALKLSSSLAKKLAKGTSVSLKISVSVKDASGKTTKLSQTIKL